MDLFLPAAPSSGASTQSRRGGEGGATRTATQESSRLFDAGPPGAAAVDPGQTTAWSVRAPQTRRPDEAYSIEQEAYRDGLAFQKRRARRRKVLSVLRALALIVLVPVALVLVFLASYVLTCIFNGASPQEVVDLVGSLVHTAWDFVREALPVG